MLIAGEGIYDTCPRCGKLVKLNKFLFGDLHLCSLDETRDEKIIKDMMQKQHGGRTARETAELMNRRFKT